MLRELLSQGEYKIGCIVNDVAAINIDAKLVRNQQTKQAIRSTSDLAPTIELQNGCACAPISISCLTGASFGLHPQARACMQAVIAWSCAGKCLHLKASTCLAE